MTQVKTYGTEAEMTRDTAKMAAEGWQVVSITQSEGRYGCCSTGCLGLIFLPLALLGKKQGSYVVTYAKSNNQP